MVAPYDLLDEGDAVHEALAHELLLDVERLVVLSRRRRETYRMSQSTTLTLTYGACDHQRLPHPAHDLGAHGEGLEETHLATEAGGDGGQHHGAALLARLLVRQLTAHLSHILLF
jgi:hypothetical protein